jgi:hypothetical protein
MTNKKNTIGCCQGQCYNAQPLLTPGDTGAPASIISNLKSAECQFRLTLPDQCTGSFTEGKLQVIVKAV